MASSVASVLTLSLFLETHAKGTRRDKNNGMHDFVVLDRELSGCGHRIKEVVLKQSLFKAYGSKYHEMSDSQVKIKTRLITVPTIPRGIEKTGVGLVGSSSFSGGAKDTARGKAPSEDEKYEAKPTTYQNRFFNPERPKENAGNEERTALDVVSLLFYQRDRINPANFQPLDLFSQDPKPTFIAAEVQVRMGDVLVPILEYICPYTHLSTPEETQAVFAVEDDAVQIRKMDRKHIQQSLDHISEIFVRIMRPERPYTPETLKADLSELVYKWTLISPYNSEENEELAVQIQTTLAKNHHFQIEVPKNLHLKVWINPYYPQFLEEYKKSVTIK